MKPPLFVIALCLACYFTPVARAMDDWDLYALKLVNRARQDPAGEAARIGSSITDATPPRAPLAYNAVVHTAATSHNNWMHQNFGNINAPDGPDSFTHFETMDGLQTGSPASSTPGFTGVDVGTRFTSAGFPWDRAGENIVTLVSTESIPVDQFLIEENHWAWWESDSHRALMLSANYTVFGHRIESRVFAPPLGGIDSPYSNINYATQNYGRPAANPRTYILGVLYQDRDGNGAWTPRDANHPQREGLGNVNYTVFAAGTTSAVATGATLANGAFAMNRGNGAYDIEFANAGTPGGRYRIENVTITLQNRDVGDHNVLAVAPGDFDGDGYVDQDDLEVFSACSSGSNVLYSAAALPAGCPAPVGSSFLAADFDQDQDVDMRDYAVLQRCYSGTAIPRPDCAD